ncbi:hypothetical protein ACFLQ5_02125 [Bacteroidota bacterium]
MQSENKKYREGDIVLMKIIKTVVLPDNEDYYVLQDPKGVKYLLKQKYYSNYNLEISAVIKCRVDKINCAGNFFFEPDHPLYEINKTYEFKVIEKKQIENEAGQFVHVLVVMDGFQNVIFIPDNKESFTQKDDFINCRIERIKKSKLFLNKIDSERLRLKKGCIYKFDIISLYKTKDGEEYYKLKGQYGSIHLLPKNYYQEYNYKIGMTIECKVEKYLSDIDCLLEPVHPVYKINKIYEFEFVERRIEKNRFGDKRDVLIVKDVFQKEGRVFINNTISTIQLKKGEVIKCKVLKFMKGSVVLDII